MVTLALAAAGGTAAAGSHRQRQPSHLVAVGLAFERTKALQQRPSPQSV